MRSKLATEACHRAEALYAIEGMGQGPLGANWGDGFGTDVEAITILQQSGLPQSDPNPFFQKLMVRSAFATFGPLLHMTPGHCLGVCESVQLLSS